MIWTVGKYALFIGCMIYQRLPHLEAVSVEVLSRLGVKVRRLDGFTCCPEPITMKVLDEEAWYSIAARNLTIAEEAGLEVLTLCPGCAFTLFKVAEELKKNLELKERVNKVLAIVNRSFKGRVGARSLLRLLYEEIGLEALSKSLSRPLKGLKVAVHLGCHIREELGHYDDLKEPKAPTELLETLGCEVLKYPSENMCCGIPIRPASEELSLSMVELKARDCKDAGADCIAVLCPMCLIQLDLGQSMLSRKLNGFFDIPVVYLAQLVGLAMGMSLDEIGLKYHSLKKLKFKHDLDLKVA